MNEELFADLAKVQRYAAEVQDLMSAADRFAPRSAVGEDKSETVKVTLDGEGLPSEFRVGPGWARSVGAARLGAAVVEAATVAAANRMAEWTRVMDENGFREKADAIEARAERAPGKPVPGELPTAFRMPAGPPRPLDVLVEDALRAFDKVEAREDRSPAGAEGTGRDSSGKVIVTLQAGSLTRCDIERSWAARQNGDGIARALEEATANARRALLQAPPDERTSEKEDLNAIFGEALAVMRDLENPRTS